MYFLIVASFNPNFKTDADKKAYEQRITKLNTIILTEAGVREEVLRVLQGQVGSLTPGLLADRRKKLDYCKEVTEKDLSPESEELKKAQVLAQEAVDHTERFKSAFEQKNKKAIEALDTYLINSLKVLKVLE